MSSCTRGAFNRIQQQQRIEHDTVRHNTVGVGATNIICMGLGDGSAWLQRRAPLYLMSVLLIVGQASNKERWMKCTLLGGTFVGCMVVTWTMVLAAFCSMDDLLVCWLCNLYFSVLIQSCTHSLLDRSLQGLDLLEGQG